MAHDELHSIIERERAAILDATLTRLHVDKGRATDIVGPLESLLAAVCAALRTNRVDDRDLIRSAAALGEQRNRSLAEVLAELEHLRRSIVNVVTPTQMTVDEFRQLSKVIHRCMLESAARHQARANR